MSGTTINISEYSRDVLKELRNRKEHKNYDSALRELFREADIDEEKLVESVRDSGGGEANWDDIGE